MDRKDIEAQTKGYAFNHTMLRIKDPINSLKFYEEVLGMRLLRKLDFEEWKFSLFFLGYLPSDQNPPKEEEKNSKFTFGREGVLELTHNWGTEELDSSPYHDGNKEPQGFGHICISVPDIHKACTRFEEMGVEFQKKLGQGGMKNLAFIKDPDGYWIEILPQRKILP